MKRAALIAGVSLAALLMAGPTSVRALPGDVNSWGGFHVLSRPPDPAQPKAKKRRLRDGDHASRKSEPEKSTPIPNGPLAIIVSIDKQRATLYADGQPIASTAVSTGTREHPTPMGVFTVIQKDKHHVSNLYNAAMPYLQRITWSGSALHEGPLPGYPASHGCVRLTSSFAQYLWKTTKMGARVIVTHPDVSPVEFESAKLFVPKPRVAEVVVPVAPAAPPVAVAAPATVPATVPAVATVPAPVPAPVVVAEPALTSGIAKVRTADAENTAAVLSLVGNAAKPATTSVVTAPVTNEPSAEQPTKLSETEGTGNAQKTEMQADAANAQAAEVKPAETKPAETADAKPAEAPAAAPVAEAKPVEPVETKPVAEVKPAEAPVAETKPVEAKAVEAKPVETKPAEAAAATIAAPASLIAGDQPTPAPTAVVPEGNGKPISVFISLKDKKVYVRQGWKSLFDAPVSIENPGQPIGTHVYTAMGVKADGPELRWTVITIPSGYRRVAELRSPERGRKHGERPVKVADIEPVEPSSPAQALDRIIMPPELVDRISAMIMPGSSLIVSDNKLSDETGDDTDFIVLTR
jgi:lipoprotein-anchoring transpeptidase ErfK/SrfK